MAPGGKQCLSFDVQFKGESKGSSQSGLVPVKDRNWVTISNKEKVKERWVEHFENVLNRDTVAGKDIDENEKVCNTLDVKEDLFSEE